MVIRRLHHMTFFLARVIVSGVSLLLVVTLASFIHFNIQQSDSYTAAALETVKSGPAVVGQAWQMVRMATTWTVQSALCPDQSPPPASKTHPRQPLCSNASHTKPTSEAAGCIVPPPDKYEDLPQSVGWLDNVCCSFATENFRPASCLIERDLFSVAAQIITPADVVLEVGSRYGTTSCTVAEIQGNSGNLITVEADPTVWNILQYNMETHACYSHMVLGVLGENDLMLMEEDKFINMPLGYARMTSDDQTVKGTQVAHFTWDEIERQTGLKITTIIFDCEGCMFPILNTYRHKIRQVEKVIIENDNHQGPHCDSECQEANRFFEESGFVLHTAFLSNLQANYVYVRNMK